jgi:hypothetical protein
LEILKAMVLIFLRRKNVAGELTDVYNPLKILKIRG